MNGEPWGGTATWLFPAIWDPTFGFNWEVLFTYLLVMVYTAFPAAKVISRLSYALQAQVDKIHFTIPLLGIKVDFNEYTWDNKFFDDVSGALLNAVRAKQGEAETVKMRFKEKIQGAKTHQELMDAVKQSRAALEKITDSLIEDFQKNGDPLFWRVLESRLGDRAKAVVWVRNKVKALIEKRKQGAGMVDMARDLLDELGNEIAPTEESND